jgi:hypothetical protein
MEPILFKKLIAANYSTNLRNFMEREGYYRYRKNQILVPILGQINVFHTTYPLSKIDFNNILPYISRPSQCSPYCQAYGVNTDWVWIEKLNSHLTHNS